MPFIIVICSVIYLIFSTPTMQNKSYTFGFSAAKCKKYNMSNASRWCLDYLDASHHPHVYFHLASRKTLVITVDSWITWVYLSRWNVQSLKVKGEAKLSNITWWYKGYTSSPKMYVLDGFFKAPPPKWLLYPWVDFHATPTCHNSHNIVASPLHTWKVYK
jgi:hypothetical protein